MLAEIALIKFLQWTLYRPKSHAYHTRHKHAGTPTVLVSTVFSNLTAASPKGTVTLHWDYRDWIVFVQIFL